MDQLVDGEHFGRTTLELEDDAGEGAWTVAIAAGRAATTREIQRGKPVILGSRPGADFVLPDAAVSGRHARLRATEEGLEVEDLGSKNGTFVGGARVRRASLRPGGSFVVGRSELSVLRGTAAGPRGAAPALLPGLVGTSAPMRRLAEEVRRVARLEAPVLIVGESGTGKDVVARAVHSLSGRAGRYVALNAGALPEALADSELFGHRRGAFTGAVQAHDGAFEQADRGTLFLDEIGDLALSIQVKLLRAVEDGEIRKLGAPAPTRVRTRIVAATWAPLSERIEQGRFRPDLYHRIATFVVSIPPLRQRRSDIPALGRALLESRRQELGHKRLCSSALQRLQEYAFPGNVRELFSTVYRAAVTANGDRIEAHHVEAALSATVGAVGRGTALDPVRLLEAHGGNVSAAARSARVARSTFRSWLKRKGVSAVPLPPRVDARVDGAGLRTQSVP